MFLMDWKKIKCPQGARLLKIHHFAYMVSGTNYQIEIDEIGDGRFTGHAEDSIDSSSVIESVTAESLESCLNQVMESIKKRHS